MSSLMSPAFFNRGLAPALLTLGLVSPLLVVQARAQTINDPDLVVEQVVAGLSVPTAMAFLAPDDILVLQKEDGQVRRVLGEVLQPDPVLDVAVNFDSERGLLGIAINKQQPPRVFLFYTEAAGDGAAPQRNRVYRYIWDAGSSTLINRKRILNLPVTPGPNHNGGTLVIGGGKLYTVIGDLNRNNQLENYKPEPPENGGPPDDSGAIFRTNPNGSGAAGNPFPATCSVSTATSCSINGDCPIGETCLARLYAYGVRNSFGLAIDPVTGALWDTENGPTSYDEINRVHPGFNSGWEKIMGPNSRDPQGVGDLFHLPGSSYSDPEFSWSNPIAPTALLFPHGSNLGTAYDNVLLVSDFINGQIYNIPLNAGRTGFDFSAFPSLEDLVADNTTERNLLRLGRNFGGISDLKLGPDGNVYVLSLVNGAIYRIRSQ